jgi:histidinol dehydrogenase
VRIRTVHGRPPFAELRDVMRAASTADPRLREDVAAIVSAVAERGDEALLEYTARFDRLPAASVAELRLGETELAAASAAVDGEQLRTLHRAAAQIRRFHERQLERGFLDLLPDGSVLGQRVTPLRRVGVYVPGGRAAYPSAVLMNVIPATVAGVDEIVMVSPAPDGVMDPLVLAAAREAGVR